MKSPVFSVIIVNFNGGKFLEEAILSIVNQKFPFYELLIIDGGSSDDSLEIISKYSSHIDYMISEPDKGQSDALNKGVCNSNGEFLFWLNSDDILLPNSLFNIYCEIKTNPSIKWFAGNTIFFNECGKIIKCVRGPKFKRLIFANAPFTVTGPSSIFHKSLINDYSLFDVNLHYVMDTDLWLKFFSNGIKFHRINSYIWGFRIHENSKTSHAFSGRPIQKFETEKKILIKRYNRNENLLGLFIQIMFKLFSGIYFFSLFDSLKFKSKSIHEYGKAN